MSGGPVHSTMAAPGAGPHDGTRMDIDPPTSAKLPQLTAITGQGQPSRSSSTMATAGSPAAEREQLLDPQESANAVAVAAAGVPPAASALPLDLDASAGPRAAEASEQTPRLGRPELPPVSPPPTTPPRAPAAAKAAGGGFLLNLQMPTAVPPYLAHASGPPSPAQSVRPGPPTPSADRHRFIDDVSDWGDNDSLRGDVEDMRDDVVGVSPA